MTLTAAESRVLRVVFTKRCKVAFARGCEFQQSCQLLGKTLRHAKSCAQSDIIVPMAHDIDRDLDAVLNMLASAKRDDYVEAAHISAHTGLTPERVNDAMSLLVDCGFADWIQTMGTGPFDFANAMITPQGRRQANRARDAADESSVLVTDQPATVPTSHSSPLKLFVSHSSEDAAFTAKLIALIRSALNLSAAAIRCTSVDGYRLPAGANTDAQLRVEVHEAKGFIGLVSASSMRSLYVLFELGARWGCGKHLIPLLSPGTPSAVLAGPLAALNALRTDSAGQLHQLIGDLAVVLGVTAASPAAYEVAMADVLGAAATVQSADPTRASKGDDILQLQAQIERLSRPKFSDEARRLAEERYKRLNREHKIALRYLLTVGDVTDRQALQYLHSKGLALNFGSVFSSLAESALVQRVVQARQYGEHVSGYTGAYTLNPRFSDALAELVENDPQSLA